MGPVNIIDTDWNFKSPGPSYLRFVYVYKVAERSGCQVKLIFYHDLIHMRAGYMRMTLQIGRFACESQTILMCFTYFN